MIEETIQICSMPQLIELGNDEEGFAAFLLPILEKYKGNYFVRLELGGGYATISFELEEIVLESQPTESGLICMRFCRIKRYTRHRLETYAETIARKIIENLQGDKQLK